MIYFIRGKQSKRIKIGYTGGDGVSRLAQLQTGSPEELELLATVDGGLDIEKRYHELFADCRVHGEWFEPSWELRELLDWHRAGAAVRNGRPIRSVYLAGKITGTTWRDSIAPEWSRSRCDMSHQAWEDVGLHVFVTASCGVAYPIRCTGPFFSISGGDHYAGPIEPGDHACGEYRLVRSRQDDWPYVETTFTDRPWVAAQAKAAIDACDLMFAWIDSPDCYGTLLEIGYALGVGKVVEVRFKRGVALDELWLTQYFAGGGTFDTAADAWSSLWPRARRKRIASGECASPANRLAQANVNALGPGGAD